MSHNQDKQSTGSETLPPKEAAIFKRLLKCYEQKQYKLGLKFAKQILSNPKCATHGETLSMKGLTLNCIGKRDEAMDCVKKGLTNGVKSHVCWHVYGLIQQSLRKYEDAMKSYRNALKLNPENVQILRDLSLLQVETRDLEGFRETRHQLLIHRPLQKANWIAYAVSLHLLKQHDASLDVLASFRRTQTNVRPFDYEHSELLMYELSILDEAGRHADALARADEFKPQICDVLGLLELKGDLLLKVGRHNEAESVFRSLIERNPEQRVYYEKLERALQLESPKDDDRRLQVYREIGTKQPRSVMWQRLPLTFLSAHHQQFGPLLRNYLRTFLRKGSPPLFETLASLYTDREKAKLLDETINGYRSSLRSSTSRFGDDDGKVIEAPTSLLWTDYLYAAHLDRLGRTTEALGIAEELLKHTPTLIELYTLLAKICKHAGDADRAANYMDEAQSLDTADRFLNSKCARYMLRANRVEASEEMCAKFTREGAAAGEHLHEMQCFWFLFEAAAAHRRLGHFGEALKKCIEVERHFMEIYEDQFDFHTYCTRKMTLRAYVRFVRLEDTLRANRHFIKAARLATEIYIRLFDSPIRDEPTQSNLDDANLSEKERKKLENKRRKAEKKQQGGAAPAAGSAPASSTQSGDKKTPEPTTEDPSNPPPLVPEKLERCEEPLTEALRFVRALNDVAHERLFVHVLAYQVAIRKRKLLLMLQAVRRGHALLANEKTKSMATSREKADFHVCYAHFLGAVRKALAQAAGTEGAPHETVRRTLLEHIAALYPAGLDTSIPDLNRTFLEKNRVSILADLAFANVRFECGEATATDAFNAFIAAVPACVERERSQRGAFDLRTENTLADFGYAFDRLREGVFGSLSDEQLAQFTRLAQSSFPLAVTRFAPPAKNGQREPETGTTKLVPNGGVEQ